METYHGGLQCCKHSWFLTDLEQDQMIPKDKVYNNQMNRVIPKGKIFCCLTEQYMYNSHTHYRLLLAGE